MGNTGRDQRYNLPEGQQWQSAQVEQYVWGNPETIDGLGKGMDTAGTELTEVADSLKGIDVSGIWRGDGAQAFLGLRDRLEPAVRGLGSMHKEAGAALKTWKTHLAVYKEDAGTAITLGRQGDEEHRRYGGPDGTSKMSRAKTQLDTARSSAESAGRTCRTALDNAVAKADVPTQPPATTQPGAPVDPQYTADGQRGKAPSGREPVWAGVPYLPNVYRDPANGQLVTPRPGNWGPGEQPWDYQPGSQPDPSHVTPVSTPPRNANFTVPSLLDPQFTTPPGNPPRAPSGATPVVQGFTPVGARPTYIDPTNGRVVVPVTGVYATGQPWPYVYADGNP